mgnify:CR=1 FL=1
MKNIILLFFLLLLMGSCSNNRMEMSQLSYIDGLMDEKPQAAYDSLCQDSCMFMDTRNRCVEMKFRLLMAKAQNKLYLQMPSDSLFQEVVAYYDVHGTACDKMLAHYLLGCVFRDQKNALQAIKCYEEALKCADSLDNECEDKLLLRIYGQMSTLYAKQNLFDEALKAERKMCKYALKSGDRASFIAGNEQIASLYYSLGDTVKAISQAESCISLYRKYGMLKSAAGPLPLLMNISIKRQQFAKACHYMQIFEKESGTFDKNGNVVNGREYYYYVKGQYLLGINKIDAAKEYFQKLDSAGFHYEANRGLLSVYRQQGDVKKVFEYMGLCEKGMDSILNNSQSSAVLQVSKLYDFQKIQERMSNEVLAKERLEKNVLVLLLAILILIFLCICILRLSRKKIKRKQSELDLSQRELLKNIHSLDESKKKIEVWNDKYLKTLDELNIYQRRIAELQSHHEIEIRDKIDQISELQRTNDEYKEKYRRMNSTEKTVTISEDEVYKRFKKKGAGLKVTDFPKKKHWDQLTVVIAYNYPLFYDMITHVGRMKKLSLTELKVAMLTRLHFSNSEMSNIMDISPSRISNAKQAINEKLYGDKNAKTLFQNMADA